MTKGESGTSASAAAMAGRPSAPVSGRSTGAPIGSRIHEEHCQRWHRLGAALLGGDRCAPPTRPAFRHTVPQRYSGPRDSTGCA